MKYLHLAQSSLIVFLGLCSLGAIGLAQAQKSIVFAATQKDLNELPKPQETFRSPKLLSLQDAIILALRNNPTVHSSRFQRISDRYALELANYAYQPHFNFSGNVAFTKGQK